MTISEAPVNIRIICIHVVPFININNVIGLRYTVTPPTPTSSHDPLLYTCTIFIYIKKQTNRQKNNNKHPLQKKKQQHPALYHFIDENNNG